jgi:periplasmic copper chaperone A
MFAMILTSVSIVAAAAQADSESLKITDAWVPAAEKSGGDVPLLMTIRNDSSSPDALMRVRCAAANFSEKHTVDRGEGAPAMRAIASIPLAADSTITLKRDGYHVMLLQTRQLALGDRFTCLIDFSKGWNDRKGGARSLVTLNVVAAGRIGLKPRQPVPDRRPTS